LLWAFALGGSALCPNTQVRAEPFFFFWDRPERPQPEERPGLTERQVRGILAREGARMLGKPRLRGDEIIALGQDREGAQKKFTLDAISGEVLGIAIVTGPPRRSTLEARPRENRDDQSPPGSPIPPPEHAPHGGDDGIFGGQPEQKPAAPQPPKAEVPNGEPVAPAKKPDDADSALSPIKPLHPAGAPKVEPLPQQ
jgi:hypothetical protein